MDLPLMTDRSTKLQPRAESIFKLKSVKALGEPKVIKETDIFEGAKPTPKQMKKRSPKKDRYAPPRSKEPPKRMRSQQGATYLGTG